MTHHFSHLSRYPELAHAVSDKASGNISLKFESLDVVLPRRERLCTELGLDLNSGVMMDVVHGADIVHVTSSDKGKGMTGLNGFEVDALMTREKSISLWLLTGDCAPIMYYDPVTHTIALAHCGWKSTDLLLAQKVVQEFVSIYHAHPSNILVGIAPCIHQESYRFADPIQKKLPAWQPFLHEQPDGQTSIDIVGYNVSQLITSGIERAHIEVMDIDTAASPDFFSHFRSTRTGEPQGRFASIIGLK